MIALNVYAPTPVLLLWLWLLAPRIEYVPTATFAPPSTLYLEALYPIAILLLAVVNDAEVTNPPIATLLSPVVKEPRVQEITNEFKKSKAR